MSHRTRHIYDKPHLASVGWRCSCYRTKGLVLGSPGWPKSTLSDRCRFASGVSSSAAVSEEELVAGSLLLMRSMGSSVRLTAKALLPGRSIGMLQTGGLMREAKRYEATISLLQCWLQFASCTAIALPRKGAGGCE